jgi:hypothetical protein
VKEIIPQLRNFEKKTFHELRAVREKILQFRYFYSEMYSIGIFEGKNPSTEEL